MEENVIIAKKNWICMLFLYIKLEHMPIFWDFYLFLTSPYSICHCHLLFEINIFSNLPPETRPKFSGIAYSSLTCYFVLQWNSIRQKLKKRQKCKHSLKNANWTHFLKKKNILKLNKLGVLNKITQLSS